MNINNNFSVWLLLFSFIRVSCNERRNDEKEVKKDTIFFTNGHPTAITSNTCYDFLESMPYSIKYFSFGDSFIRDELLDSIVDNIIEMDDRVVDVRYRILLDTNIICLDSFGYGYYNDKYIGQYKKFNYLKKVIENNRDVWKSYKELPYSTDSQSTP